MSTISGSKKDDERDEIQKILMIYMWNMSFLRKYRLLFYGGFRINCCDNPFVSVYSDCVGNFNVTIV